MKNNGIYPLLFLLALTLSCTGQNKEDVSTAKQETSKNKGREYPGGDEQIDEYVVEIFEDSKGQLWFGTLSKGVARYDGEQLVYLDKSSGLIGNGVVSIVEDSGGNLWFGTHSGLSKYDGKSFTNYTTEDGLCHDRVSQLMIYKTGTLWVGTWGGVCTFDGSQFTDFHLPIPEVELLPYQSTMNWITEMMEDQQGNIWFGRDGYGACKYDGNTFVHFTKKDGLPSNNVQAIEEDQNGHIWLGTRVAEKDHPDEDKRSGEGGLVRYDGQSMIRYPEVAGFSGNDVYTIYEGRSHNIWISTVGAATVYRFDGAHFTPYHQTSDKGERSRGPYVQSVLEDRNGTLWFGASGGLFRLEDSILINVRQNGPWE